MAMKINNIYQISYNHRWNMRYYVKAMKTEHLTSFLPGNEFSKVSLLYGMASRNYCYAYHTNPKLKPMEIQYHNRSGYFI